MSLNLKNPETVRMARELAERTGESMTEAITVALRERLARLPADNSKAGLAEWLDNLSHFTAPLLKDLPASDQVGDLLFDRETGLPL